MKSRDLANLLNRAAAALEASEELGGDLNPQAIAELIEDLTSAAKELSL